MDAPDDKARARQLRAEARRRRRDEALRRYQERTERRTERDALHEAQRAAAERLERAQAEARAQLEAERLAAEAAEREAAERRAEEDERRRVEETVVVEPIEEPEQEQEPVEPTVVLRDESSAHGVEAAGPDATEPDPVVERADEPPGESDRDVADASSMTVGLPAAPREFATQPRDERAVPAPPSPRRSLLVRIVRLLGSLAVALGSLASILLALGALTLALGERPVRIFEAIEPVCRTLALGTGAELSPLDTLVTWIVAAIAYLIIGFALQAFSRQITGRRRRV